MMRYSAVNILYSKLAFMCRFRSFPSALKNFGEKLPTRTKYAEPGQTVALVGHSGCGKSTVVGLLLRYYDQQSGTLTIDGVPVRDLNIQWLRNIVGVVSQEPVLFAATIEENLRMGNELLTEHEMIQACIMANAHEFITKLSRVCCKLIIDTLS
uniref:AAA+ ATPase domain-containing protein n=1 Tax=Parascaris equorum TaxID=6256 RepID=A0A914RMC9_PAREQ